MPHISTANALVDALTEGVSTAKVPYCAADYPAIGFGVIVVVLAIAVNVFVFVFVFSAIAVKGPGSSKCSSCKSPSGTRGCSCARLGLQAATAWSSGACNSAGHKYLERLL
jgi:hypothetical protein